LKRSNQEQTPNGDYHTTPSFSGYQELKYWYLWVVDLRLTEATQS
jgi:hypothetical protein